MNVTAGHDILVFEAAVCTFVYTQFALCERALSVSLFRQHVLPVPLSRQLLMQFV